MGRSQGLGSVATKETTQQRNAPARIVCHTIGAECGIGPDFRSLASSLPPEVASDPSAAWAVWAPAVSSLPESPSLVASVAWAPAVSWLPESPSLVASVALALAVRPQALVTLAPSASLARALSEPLPLVQAPLVPLAVPRLVASVPLALLALSEPLAWPPLDSLALAAL